MDYGALHRLEKAMDYYTLKNCKILCDKECPFMSKHYGCVLKDAIRAAKKYNEKKFKEAQEALASI